MTPEIKKLKEQSPCGKISEGYKKSNKEKRKNKVKNAYNTTESLEGKY